MRAYSRHGCQTIVYGKALIMCERPWHQLFLGKQSDAKGGTTDYNICNEEDRNNFTEEQCYLGFYPSPSTLVDF